MAAFVDSLDLEPRDDFWGCDAMVLICVWCLLMEVAGMVYFGTRC